MALCTKRSATSRLKKNILPLLSLASIILGIGLGCGLRYAGPLGYDALAWISIWGELFMRMLKCLILPLVMTCLITGITSHDSHTSKGRVGTVAFLYIIIGNFLGSFIGVVFAAVMQPGSKMNHQTTARKQYTSYTDIFQDLLRNLVPDNLIRMTTHSAYTDYDITWAEILTNHSTDDGNMTLGVKYDIADIVRTLHYRASMNTIGLVSVSIAVGIGLNAAGKQAEPLLHVIQALYAVVEKLLFAMFWYAPIGIFSLIASAIIKVDSLEEVMISLGMYMLTFFICFLVHFCIYIPLLYFIICRKNPLKYFARIADALMAGFAPPSSSAALPFLIEDVKSKLGIRPELAHFFLPLSVTVNRDGSAMFVTCTAVFVAQAQGIQLSAGSYIILIFITTIMSFTIATVPSSSVVLAIIVCQSIQVPIQDMIGVIMLTEFIMDRLRTLNNVASHGFGCAIVQRFCSVQEVPDERVCLDDMDLTHQTATDDRAEEKLLKGNDLPMA